MDIFVLAIVLASFALGYVIASIFSKKEPLGVLKVMNAETEEPYLFLELDEDIYHVCNELKYKKYVLFEVEHEFDPQI